MKMRFRGWTASIILASIVSNQVLFAYGPEASFWEERRQEQKRRSIQTRTGLLARGPSPTSLFGQGGVGSLPVIEKCPVRSYAGSTPIPKGLGETYGHLFSAVPLANATIRKISLPSNKTPRGLIFHIQDVHRNLDAQTNISQVVTSLINVQSGSPTVALVGLEGAFRPYDLSWLRSFPDPKATRIAAEDLLAQDKMSGPIFSLLTSPGAIPSVVGIDDLTHYTANIDAYLRSLPSRDTVQARVNDQQKVLDELKVRTFPPALWAFDQTVQAYHRGNGSLGAYARALDNKGGSPLAEPIALFLRALGMEEALDFKQVDIERTTLIETLSKKMNQTQTNELIARSVSYRAGQLSYGDFYRWLLNLCNEVGVSLSGFPAMGAYIRYVLLSESIDAEALLRETDKRERDVFRQWAKTEDEKKIVDESHRLSLVMKLVDFALTPTEWAEYERTRSQTSIDSTLEPYETFYREAHARDTAMAENFIHSLATLQRPQEKETPFPISIVVTGGYHGPGLTEKLTKAGMAVVTVVPKIQKIETTQGSSYLTVFAQEKTPLDKLFEGAKLFVADSPLSPQNAALQALSATSVTVRPGVPIAKAILEFLECHFSNVNVQRVGPVAQIQVTFMGKVLKVIYDPSKPVGKRASLDKSPDGWGERLQGAVASSNLVSMGKELRWFLGATVGPALALGMALYFGVGVWAVVLQILLGLGAAKSNWPTFRAGHETSKNIWLVHNPGKTADAYYRDLNKRYWSIVLVSELVSVGLSFFLLGGPSVDGWKAAQNGMAVWAFSVFLGPFLFHGAQNFIGSLRHGRSYVAAMSVERKGALPPRLPGDPWNELSEIPEGFLRGRTVIVRTNLDDTQLSYDDMRLVLAAKTVRHLSDAGAKVVLLSHMGRPTKFTYPLTLNSRAEKLERMVGKDFKFLPGENSQDFRWLSEADKEAIRTLSDGEVAMLQNTRFDPRETSRDPEVRQAMAQELVDTAPNALFVLDGFPVAHRANTASMDGLAQRLPGVKGLWQSLEEAQHNKFLSRLDNPEVRGKLTVLFGGGKLDKQVEIDTFCREHLRAGDTLIVGGLFSEKLLTGDLRSELENRGVTILLPDPTERPMNDKTHEDVGPEFTRKAIAAINDAQSVFWEGPLGRYRDPQSKSLEVARAIARWASEDPKRRAFISGGSTSFLFKEANGWDEVQRTQAKGITVSTGGGTSIFYFAHRGYLPGTEGLRGWEPQGHVDLKEYPNFWRDILKDPRTFGYAFVVDKDGNYEAHARRIRPGKFGSDLFNDVTQMLLLQERVNVGYGSEVGEDGVPVFGRFYLTEGHQDFVVFDKDGNSVLVGEKENPVGLLENPSTVLGAIQNPDRAKRSGSERGISRETAEKAPGMRVLTAENILTLYPLELFLEWHATEGTEWWGTGNRTAYYSNDPEGDPLEQVDHVTFSSSVDRKSQSEIGSLGSFKNLMEYLTKINSSANLKNRPKFRFGGNSWYANKKNKEGKDFKAGASQNVRHAHALRVIFPIEHAPRKAIGQVQNVGVSVLADPENGPGLVLEADSSHVEDLAEVAYRTINDIIERGHAYNFIIVQTESGFRIFIADKINGLPSVRFFNEMAFAEFGRLLIVDDPTLFYLLTADQLAEIEKMTKEAKAKEINVNLTPWVKKEKKANRLNTVDPQFFQDSLAALRSVSSPAEEIEALAQRLIQSSNRAQGPPRSSETAGPPTQAQDDSLLSRLFFEMERNSISPVAKTGWRWGRLVNNLVAAPLYETAIFFLLPAASGSLFLLTGGFLIFVRLHFWDDYTHGKSTGLSPPEALALASKSAVSRFVRASILYAAPFAIYMVFPDVFQILSNVGSALSADNELIPIAGMVALIHSGRNIVNRLKARSGLVYQAQKDGRQIAAVLFGKPADVPTDKLIRNQALWLAFPATDSLQLETFGSPGQRFINNVGRGLQNNTYSAEFGAALLDEVRSYLSRDRGQVPSTAQMLARLQVFAFGGASATVDIQSGGVGEKIPVQLEIISAKDVPVLSKTLELMKAVNEDQKKPLHLLLAGVDTKTVKALKELAKGFDHVSIMENPVGVGIEKSEMWRLDPVVLNQGYREFQRKFQESVSLSVSLSDGISFSKEDLDHSGSSSVDQALKEALLRYFLSPLQPLHVASMLNLIRFAQQAINQSA